VKLASGADSVINPGTIVGDVRLGGGADIFDATGGLVAGVARGGRGNDVLTGGLSGDRLSGGRGDDVLDGGGASRDVLKGGKGADTFVFAAFHGVDRIKDFDVGEDRIRLDNALLHGLDDGPLAVGAFVVGSRAADADDRIIYDDRTGILKYDANGELAGGVVKIAKLAPGLELSHHHFEIV
jgi:cysteinyl-tRNA synthetase